MITCTTAAEQMDICPSRLRDVTPPRLPSHGHQKQRSPATTLSRGTRLDLCAVLLWSRAEEREGWGWWWGARRSHPQAVESSGMRRRAYRPLHGPLTLTCPPRFYISPVDQRGWRVTGDVVSKETMKQAKS
ncbi:hypothetical protein DPEC_G00305380 [Dallia pectoralis]|uniref:Uncharacterized protein n=1 Tax=Dallia pectoralis TaxID=75939 RepID=A0ACC2FDT3_DALPE|nr:hypothetical protein DPEC_G00305380 [Dallia pectoralis]